MDIKRAQIILKNSGFVKFTGVSLNNLSEENYEPMLLSAVILRAEEGKYKYFVELEDSKANSVIVTSLKDIGEVEECI
ncbi:hypothetical protein [Peptoniphilus lacrimalis]|uniref:Uncharacterized protein n=1 Tax=Peptoniphilus lacrimalis TaxID=33031 RepID=A0A379C670_9FIRM|nr:hypothetical protein [Peptoniphilus lacrimalis]SUB57734.1 Uncharacterised protein [Peptoniphilus lacrimalis]